jgi:hypothetical protein
VVLRHLEAVLNPDVVRVSGVLGRELPSPGPELDPREPPQGTGASRLVSLAPLSVLALEQGAGLVPLRGRRERVHQCLRRLLHETFPAERAREVSGQLRQIGRRLSLAHEPAQDRLHGASTLSEQVVVEAFRKLESGTGVFESRPVALCPREAAVDE